jgi:hypothetical protein
LPFRIEAATGPTRCGSSDVHGEAGPRELPAYVWPRGDELAMQAFVLGAVTNLDPEEDDED